MPMNDACIYVNAWNISGTVKTSVAVTTTQNRQSSTEDPIILIAIMGSGVVIGLLIILMIILVLFLYHFKRKAGKLTEEKQGVYINVKLLHVAHFFSSRYSKYINVVVVHSFIHSLIIEIFIEHKVMVIAN